MKPLIRISVLICFVLVMMSCQNTSESSDNAKEGAHQNQELLPNAEGSQKHTPMPVDELEGELNKMDEALENIMQEMEKEMEYEADKDTLN